MEKMISIFLSFFNNIILTLYPLAFPKNINKKRNCLKLLKKKNSKFII